MVDGSSARIKVAQYFVNKKLQELESKNLQIKTDDLTFLQALPHPQQQEHSFKFEQGVDEPPPLPPLIPKTEGGYVSWESLLDVEKGRWPHGPRGGKPIFPPWYCVAIIGAGVAGLRTAALLQDYGIPYKIFEASKVAGGRVFTYQFASGSEDPQGKHDYYDVGAMRFPDNDANQRTFELFDELDLSSKKIPYIFSTDDNIRDYNGIKTTANIAKTAGDHFKDEPFVPEPYISMVYPDLRGKSVYGVNACTAAAYDGFRKDLIDDFDDGWETLMKYDWASTRSYLARGLPHYPLPVVHWMETRNSGTGGFDRAFSEAILDSLEFDDPRKDVQWWCLEGGSKVLIDAMLKKLHTKPSYGQRVTAVEPHFLLPHKIFPGVPWFPRFPFMKVSVSGQPDEHFSHVVSTTTFAALRTIDTDQVPMTYKQRQAIRTLGYGPAVKVGIKFKTRWWEQDGQKQFGGSSYTDRQVRTVVYPSYGRGEEGPGILMATYNWHQDASRFGALIQNPDRVAQQLDPDRLRPEYEKVLLDQIYGDLAALHGVSEDWLREQTLDYHAFDWYHNPYTMGAFAHFAPGQFSTFFADIVQPAAYGRFHFAGEVASHHHAWVAGALDSAVRVVDEILRWDFPPWFPRSGIYRGSLVFRDEETAKKHFVRGLFSRELEEAEFKANKPVTT